MTDDLPYIDPNNPPRVGPHYLEALLFVKTPQQAIDYCEQHGLPVPQECPKFPRPSLRFRRYISSLRASVSLYVIVPESLWLELDPDYQRLSAVAEPSRQELRELSELRSSYLGDWKNLKQLPLVAIFTARRIAYIYADAKEADPIILRFKPVP